MPCPMTQEQLKDICRLMDLNKDGQVDLNEFLESFRMVDPETRLKYLTEKQEETSDHPKNNINQNAVNGVTKSDNDTEVQVHNPSKTEDQASLNVHKNNLQMSPVLSSRRGSLI